MLMNVYWLEQNEADVPRENDWLSASEMARLNGMRVPKRRNDWRLGRWTAKHAVAAFLNLPAEPCSLTGIELRPAASGAPEVFIANEPSRVAISLSHRAGLAVCAVAPPHGAIGCDLETIEPHSAAFVDDYFTTDEQELVARMTAGDQPQLLALLWSGKESALKALRAGLRLDTRSLSVLPVLALRRQNDDGKWCIVDSNLGVPSLDDFNGWRPLHVRYTHGQVFHGWWQHTGNLVRTIVATPPTAPPILLTRSRLKETGGKRSTISSGRSCAAEAEAL